MELLLPGVDPLVRQQHQHARGRLAPQRLPLGADAHAEQVRARPRPAQGERGQPLRRGRARGADGGRSRSSCATRSSRARPRPSSATPGMAGFVESIVNTGLGEFLEENPSEARAVIMQGRAGPARARGRAQGARPDAAQVGAGELDAARQARRLLGQGPGARRAVRGRGRLRRRLGQAGPRPQHAGGAAAARQDPQRREVAHRQGPAERRDPGADHGDRHRRARRVQHRERPLPQGRS